VSGCAVGDGRASEGRGAASGDQSGLLGGRSGEVELETVSEGPLDPDDIPGFAGGEKKDTVMGERKVTFVG